MHTFLFPRFPDIISLTDAVMTLIKSLIHGKGEQFGRVGFFHRTHRPKKNRRYVDRFGSQLARKKKFEKMVTEEMDREMRQARQSHDSENNFMAP